MPDGGQRQRSAGAQDGARGERAPRAEATGPQALADPLARARMRDPLVQRRPAMGLVIQRVKYAALSDSQQALVDHVADQDFDRASEAFEMQLGLAAYADERSAFAANTLLHRTLTLRAQIEATKAEIDRKDQGALMVELFGIERRQDITGYVQPSPELLLDVVQNGSVREKMGLFYVSMAEKQTLNKVLSQAIELQHKSGLVKPTVSTTSPSVVSAAPRVSAYATNRMEKEHFRRAMEWVLQDIELARKAIENATPVEKRKVLDREAQDRQQQDDQLLAGRIVTFVTGGTLVGDETRDPTKVQRFAYLARACVFAREAESRTSVRSEQTEQTKAFGAEHTKLTDEYAKHAEVFSAGYGKLKFLMEAVFANIEPVLNEKVLEEASTYDLEPDLMKAHLKKVAIDQAWVAVGKSLKNQLNNWYTDEELNEALRLSLDDVIGDKRRATELKLLKAEVTKAEKGSAQDRTAERIAERRFNMNFLGASLLGTKHQLEESRKGSSRTMAPEKDQRSKNTASELEKTPLQLTWRELGSAFYTKDELSKRITRFMSENSIDTSVGITGGNAEKFRLELLKENGDKPLPWKPGVQFWKLDPKSALVQASETLRVRVGAALSGTTDRVMRSAKLLGLEGKDLESVLVACLGWMLPARDHTFFEIMKAAEPYVGLAPPENPFSDSIIDVDYAQGIGYRKALALFPKIDKGALPDFFLTRTYKDIIAEKLQLEPPSEADQTLRVLSDHDGQPVTVGAPVTYAVRQPPKEKLKSQPRYEWYFLRHEGGSARAQALGEGERVKRAWDYKGLYKLYALVHLDDNKQTGTLPAATLRYDQLVYSKEALEGGGSNKVSEEQTTKGDHDAPKLLIDASFTTWEGKTTPIPARWVGREYPKTSIGGLFVPAKLSQPEGPSAVYHGRVPRSEKIMEGSRTTALFDQLYRKPADARNQQALAALEASRLWEKQQAYDGTGSVNVNIIDAASGVVLKEHFFTVDRLGTKVNSPDQLMVPAYRTQGGDFVSGIKSSVRLVHTPQGQLEVSGAAMVWVNFGDKARLVWWLNNRTDRSYTVAFTVQGTYLQEVAKIAVPEALANLEDEHTSEKVNEGKPIISQDKATHQYAISEGKQGKPYPTLESMKQAAGKHLAKMFQWKTFDLETPTEFGLAPRGKGQLAHPFNEKLKRARDLELQVRLLKATGGQDEEVQQRQKQAEQLQKEGMEQWREDYNTNLRKPGTGELSTKDRRRPTELDDEELKVRAFFFASKIKEALQKKLAGALGKGKGGVIKAVEGATDLGPPTLELKNALAGATIHEVGLASLLLAGLPKSFQDRVLVFGFNLLVEAIVNELKDHKKLSTKVWDSGALLKALRKTDNDSSDFEASRVSPVVETQTANKSTPLKPSTGALTLSTLGPLTVKPIIDFETIIKSPEQMKTVKTSLELGGISQAGNTCYLASILQIIAISSTYRGMFEQMDLTGVLGPRRLVVQGVRALVRAINRGEGVPGEVVQQLREHLVEAGWRSGRREALASQEDAAELLRFLTEEIVRGPSGLEVRHTWGRMGEQPRERVEHTGLVELGGLGTVDRGRTVLDLLAEHYRGSSIERDRGGDITHTHRITALPRELSVEIRRYDFVLQSQAYIARNEPIAVGDTLVLPSALTGDGRKHRYALRGFVVHLGMSPRAGHYVAYVKRGDQWFCANDSTVTPVQPDVVARERQRAYIYHYVYQDFEMEPFPLIGPSQEEQMARRLQQNPDLRWPLIQQRIVEHQDEPGWIRSFLLLLGAQDRREIRIYLTTLSVPDKKMMALVRSVLEILDDLERELMTGRTRI